MKKLAVPALLVMLCTPAIADIAAPVPTRASFKLGFGVLSKAPIRTHSISVVADDCAEVSESETDHSDQIRVCAISETKDRVMLRIDWTTRNGANEYRGKQSLVVERNNRYTIGSPGTAHLELDVK